MTFVAAWICLMHWQPPRTQNFLKIPLFVRIVRVLRFSLNLFFCVCVCVLDLFFIVSRLQCSILCLQPINVHFWNLTALFFLFFFLFVFFPSFDGGKWTGHKPYYCLTDRISAFILDFQSNAVMQICIWCFAKFHFSCDFLFFFFFNFNFVFLNLCVIVGVFLCTMSSLLFRLLTFI